MSDQENDTNLISNNEAGTSISDIMQSAYIEEAAISQEGFTITNWSDPFNFVLGSDSD